jgi:hypothetical protein
LHRRRLFFPIGLTSIIAEIFAVGIPSYGSQAEPMPARAMQFPIVESGGKSLRSNYHSAILRARRTRRATLSRSGNTADFCLLLLLVCANVHQEKRCSLVLRMNWYSTKA